MVEERHQAQLVYDEHADPALKEAMSSSHAQEWKK